MFFKLFLRNEKNLKWKQFLQNESEKKILDLRIVFDFNLEKISLKIPLMRVLNSLKKIFLTF